MLLQICAGQRDTVVHTVRELMRVTAGSLTPRWSLDGFQTAHRNPAERASTRNLFAFRDGTANPDVTDEALMRQLIWVGNDLGEPSWATDGTYVVVRAIRQHVEFWDRVGMLEQEQMIGRDRVSGAPLGAPPSSRTRTIRRTRRASGSPQRPYPARQPAHPADRRPADPAPPLQLQPRL